MSGTFIRPIFSFFISLIMNFLPFWDIKFCTDSYFGMFTIRKSVLIELEVRESQGFQPNSSREEPNR